MTAQPGATPRIAPLPQSDLRALADRIGGTAGQTLGNAAGPLAGRPVLNVLGTIAHHPGLLSDLLPLLNRLGQGLLPPRDREITILRVAHHTQSPYEWVHHALIGAAAGLLAEEIARIPDGPAHPDWDDADSTLLRAVDELHGDGAISQTTWEHLADRYSPHQLLELLALTGVYTLVAYVLNSCRVPLDDWLGEPAPLPDRHRISDRHRLSDAGRSGRMGPDTIRDASPPTRR
ncbi:carboxymuconolactone decarboxylase family protein [Streptomyces sp. NPDC057579]|uniref:carboxymuconolactone decarboxylase family protein n=1 Tax=Streptomyces sp. NPDC057579 TaxID=3346172 RepID=UPI0036BC9E2C